MRDSAVKHGFCVYCSYIQKKGKQEKGKQVVQLLYKIRKKYLLALLCNFKKKKYSTLFVYNLIMGFLKVDISLVTFYDRMPQNRESIFELAIITPF